MPLNPLNLGVIVRTCGRSPLFLRRALHSITTQTLLPALIVVVDDSAEPVKTEAALEGKNGRGIRVKFLPRDPNTQPQPNRATALNRGIAASDTRWIAFLDDDDTWMPEFLEKVATVLNVHESDKDFGGVVTQTLAVHEKLTAVTLVEKRRERFNPDLQAVDLAALFGGNRFTINAMVVKREVFTVAGGYRADLSVLEDWEFNIRAVTQFHFEVIAEPLVCYHQRPSDDTSANTPIDEHVRAGARIRNEWLRADLTAGRIGISQLAAIGEIRELQREIRSLLGALAFVRRWRNKVLGWFGSSGQ